MSDDEKIGEIRITEESRPLSGHKYLVYLRLPAEIDTDQLAEHVDHAFSEHSWQLKDVEAEKAKCRFPRDFEALWKAVAEVDNIEVPPHKYRLMLWADEPAGTTEELETQIAEMLEHENLVPQNHGGMYVIVQKVDLFPDEKPRILQRIPLTRGMLKQARDAHKKKEPDKSAPK